MFFKWNVFRNGLLLRRNLIANGIQEKEKNESMGERGRGREKEEGCRKKVERQRDGDERLKRGDRERDRVRFMGSWIVRAGRNSQCSQVPHLTDKETEAKKGICQSLTGV